ncbi:MAG: hypothetical protein ACFFD4_08255 [Candidatus Odinarchaeota archaeon]
MKWKRQIWVHEVNTPTAMVNYVYNAIVVIMIGIGAITLSLVIIRQWIVDSPVAIFAAIISGLLLTVFVLPEFFTFRHVAHIDCKTVDDQNTEYSIGDEKFSSLDDALASVEWKKTA